MFLHFVGYFFIVLKKCRKHGKHIEQRSSFGWFYLPITYHWPSMLPHALACAAGRGVRKCKSTSKNSTRWEVLND